MNLTISKRSELKRLIEFRFIILDSILWCGDNEQLQFVTKNQFQILQNKKPISYFQIAESNDQQWWIDFISYDPLWTKERILNMIDFEKIDKALITNDLNYMFRLFPDELLKAIQNNKILFFSRRCN